MSSVKVCCLLALVTLALFSATSHAQLFGGNRATNNIRPFCILAQRLQKRMNCGSSSSAMCTYIQNNMGRCPQSGTLMRTLGRTVKNLNQQRASRGALRIPVPKMNMGHN